MAKRRRSRKSAQNKANGANLGFEEKLWQAADKLRGSIDAAPAAPFAVELGTNEQCLSPT